MVGAHLLCMIEGEREDFGDLPEDIVGIGVVGLECRRAELTSETPNLLLSNDFFRSYIP